MRTQSCDEGLDSPNDTPSELQQFANLFAAHLPQGTPTSPTLANLCAWPLDCRLTGLAARFDAKYSRYADDLIFSGHADFARRLTRFRIAALAIVHNEGFECRNRKTLAIRTDQCQTVTRLVGNQKPNISQRKFDRVKAILTNCERYRPASQNREQLGNFKAHLQRRIAYIGSVNPANGTRL